MKLRPPAVEVQADIVYMLNVRDRLLADIVLVLKKIAHPKVSIKQCCLLHVHLKQLRKHFIVADDALGLLVASLEPAELGPVHYEPPARASRSGSTLG